MCIFIHLFFNIFVCFAHFVSHSQRVRPLFVIDPNMPTESTMVVTPDHTAAIQMLAWNRSLGQEHLFLTADARQTVCVWSTQDAVNDVRLMEEFRVEGAVVARWIGSRAMVRIQSTITITNCSFD